MARHGARVRLLTRNGNDWTARYPLIVEAALKNRTTNFVLDGEAVLLGVDGISDFNGLHSRRHDDEVQLYAFDVLALARLLARRPEGIIVSEFERGEIGPDLFGKPANSVSRAWCQSAVIVPTALADRPSGSR